MYMQVFIDVRLCRMYHCMYLMSVLELVLAS